MEYRCFVRPIIWASMPTLPISSEMMAMTLMGQMLMEDGIAKGIKRGIEQGIEQGLERGIEQGIEQGEFKTLLSLIEDGFLTKKEAAARKGMTVEQFQGKLMELKLI